MEDAENQFAGSGPVNAGCLRPVSSRPQETAQARSSEQLLSCPTASSEASDLPALGLRLPTSSMLRAVRGPPSTTPLRPVSTSSSWTGNQRRVTLTEVLKEPARPQSSASHPLLTFESKQQVIGGFEGPEQDEFDKVLASMELEGPGMELELGVNSEATGILSTWHQEDSVLAKKARVADLSRSCPKRPIPATHITGVTSAQGQPLDPVVYCRTPQPHLRTGAVGNLPMPTASTVSAQQTHWEVCPKGSTLRGTHPLQATGRPIQSSPQNRGPSQSFQSPNAHLSGKPNFPRTPSSSCSTLSRTLSGFSPRGPLQLRAPVSSVESPVSTPMGPHSSLVPQATLQMPIVTNHLVQLVTAANRTPQPPKHTTTRAKTRRFPGPAGILPHQVSDSFFLAEARTIEDGGGGQREEIVPALSSPRISSFLGGEEGRTYRGEGLHICERIKRREGRIECLKNHMRGVLQFLRTSQFLYVC